MDNQKWTIHRNWQHRVHKTKKNKAKTQYNIVAPSWEQHIIFVYWMMKINRITTRLVAFATRSDTGSHNRLDLIENPVPPHYVCNGHH
jgi:hypothetical protein